MTTGPGLPPGEHRVEADGQSRGRQRPGPRPEHSRCPAHLYRRRDRAVLTRTPGRARPVPTAEFTGARPPATLS